MLFTSKKTKGPLEIVGSTRFAMDSETWPRVTREEGRDFIVRCMTSVGMSSDHANVLANNLITADYRGHYSHGLNRLCEFSKV